MTRRRRVTCVKLMFQKSHNKEGFFSVVSSRKMVTLAHPFLLPRSVSLSIKFCLWVINYGCVLYFHSICRYVEAAALASEVILVRLKTLVWPSSDAVSKCEPSLWNWLHSISWILHIELSESAFFSYSAGGPGMEDETWEKRILGGFWTFQWTRRRKNKYMWIFQVRKVM